MAADSGSTLRLRGASAARPPGHDGWSTSGRPAARTTTRAPGYAADRPLTLGGQALQVSGEAWFDHQWGDFIAVGGGGWDWFAVNLADGSDLTLSLVRDRDGSYALVYGTLVRPDGETLHLARQAFTVTVTGIMDEPAHGRALPVRLAHRGARGTGC